MALILIRGETNSKLLNAIADMERHGNLNLVTKPKVVDSNFADSIVEKILNSKLRTKSKVATAFFVKEDTFNEIISYLDGIDKKIIIYRFKYNMFIKDISKLLNLRPQIVSKRIKRALNKLFELIK